MRKVSGGPGRGGHPPHPRFFQDPLRWAGCMFAGYSPPTGVFGSLWAPGVRSEAWTQGEGGGKCRWGCSPGDVAFMSRGTCDTRYCSWCRSGEDTGQPTGTRSGTGNGQERVCAGTPGPRSAHRCLLLPSEPELWCRWAKALSHKEPTSRGKATQNHDGVTWICPTSPVTCP